MTVGGLPPGQRREPLERFGLPEFARRRVVPPERPVLGVGGDVRRATQVGVAELLAGLPRRDQSSDLHCVTTWTAPALRWSGVALADVLDRLTELAGPSSSARWLLARGLDGYRSCLRLDDARAEGVLLADTLDGVPLGPEHGAPLRLVAPAHYGYKNVKHLASLEFRREYSAGSAGWKGHPRGRAELEERSRYLPGPVWRRAWSAALPLARRPYRA